MRKISFFLLVFILISSCEKETNTFLPLEQQAPLTRTEINNIITTTIQETGDFEWENTSAHVIWSALQLSDGLVTLGYGTSTASFEMNAASNSIKERLLTTIYELEDVEAAATTLVLFEEEVINVLDLTILKKATVEALLEDPEVRYVTPSGYRFLDFSQAKSTTSSSLFGCNTDAVTLATQDYRIVSPGAKVPWNFDSHNIPQAWEHSTGAGITIAIVDTGLSPEQSLMNSSFNDGFSNGRTVEKNGTYVDSWWFWSTETDGVDDQCGHGSKMAAVATAPRNNNNLPVGVAYNANLVTYRAVSDVFMDSYHEQRGVFDALVALADREDVDIISMSIGHPFTINRVKDAIRYAHSRGKLIFAAGGTSSSFTSWYGVIFPASMPETVAVTGVKENEYTSCDSCHAGPQIDFTVEMERENTLSHVPILSYYNDEENYVGGSSVATATTAGIAALVWAKHPNWTRAQVLQKMKESADFYPTRNALYGYGKIDVLQAVQ